MEAEALPIARAAQSPRPAEHPARAPQPRCRCRPPARPPGRGRPSPAPGPPLPRAGARAAGEMRATRPREAAALGVSVAGAARAHPGAGGGACARRAVGPGNPPKSPVRGGRRARSERPEDSAGFPASHLPHPFPPEPGQRRRTRSYKKPSPGGARRRRRSGRGGRRRKKGDGGGRGALSRRIRRTPHPSCAKVGAHREVQTPLAWFLRPSPSLGSDLRS